MAPPSRSRPRTLGLLLLALAATACSAADSSELSGADEDKVFKPEKPGKSRTSKTPGTAGASEAAEASGASEETPPSAPAADTTVGSTLVTTADLNLRSGPGTTFDILVTVPSGASVTLVKPGQENGFLSVKYASLTGWASAKYLEGPAASTPDTGGAATPPPATSTKVTIGGPAVRPHVQTFANAACSQVGCPYTVGTYVGHQPTAELAIDMMMAPGGTRPKDGGAHGGKVAEFGLANAEAHRIDYVIWYQRINSNDGRGWRTMADRGSITQNHYDHVHVSFEP